MSKKTFSVRYIVFMVIFSIVVLEVGARFLYEGPENTGVMGPNYLQISNGYERLEDHIESFNTCSSTVHDLGKVEYNEYWIFSKSQCQSKTINFIDYFNSRATPSSKNYEEADLIVWAFGGSTMMNLETADGDTIANTIAKNFNAAGLNARVENFGTGTFQSSLELAKFVAILSRAPRDKLPDVVIFYDGYNETNNGFYYGAGHIQNDLAQKLAALVQGERGRLLLYSFTSAISEYSVFWKSFVHPFIHRRLFNNDPQPGEENLRRSVDIYVRNTETADGICRSIGAQCYFVLQPIVLTKSDLGEVEKGVVAELETRKKGQFAAFVRDFYDLTRKSMAGRDNFIDLSTMFDGESTDIFYDFGHTSALASPTIGDAIASEVLARMSHGK